MKILTSAEMREVDRRAIEEVGIPGALLMENAGIQVVRAVLARFSNPDRERIVVVAGKGNNGGDGLVVARHFFNMGAKPEVLLLAKAEEVKGDAALNLGIARRLGIPVAEIETKRDWTSRRKALSRATIVIDAIFGTGLLKPLDGLFARAVEDINESPGFRVAVDIPSGLSSDTPRIIGPCVKAGLTVALAAPKISHVFPPAEDFVGVVVIVPIGIPPILLEDPSLKLEFVERKDIAASFRKRKRDTHKGTYGHLLVISGSLGKTGAASLAGKSALLMGAGLVTVATPKSALPIVARSMPELMTEPLAEIPEGAIAREALPRTLELLKGKDAVLIGPGLGTNPSTAEFVLSVLPKLKIPVVIDADGLNIIARKPDVLRSLKAPALLTPHPGEFARLLGIATEAVLDRRLELAPEFAAKYGVCLVLKGYRTLISASDGRLFVNPTGNPGLATGGTGDVLAGMIASEIMQTREPVKAATAAVYAHGLSADLAAARLGQKAMIAGDIIRFLPRALKSLEQE